jgi:hypothetical protein
VHPQAAWIHQLHHQLPRNHRRPRLHLTRDDDAVNGSDEAEIASLRLHGVTIRLHARKLCLDTEDGGGSQLRGLSMRRDHFLTGGPGSEQLLVALAFHARVLLARLRLGERRAVPADQRILCADPVVEIHRIDFAQQLSRGDPIADVDEKSLHATGRGGPDAIREP